MKKEFKTTEEIKVALSRVADMMEQEVFIHQRRGSLRAGQAGSKYNFSMNITADNKYDCGTVACIGGWCWLLNNEKPIEEDGTIIKYRKAAIGRAGRFVDGYDDLDRPAGLDELFYPSFEHIDGLEHLQYGDVTTKQAAKAIRNYIEFDAPDWGNVMAEMKEDK